MAGSTTHRVLITDVPWPDLDVERSVLEPGGAEVVRSAAATSAELAEEVRDFDAVGAHWAKVTADVLAAGGADRNGLKLVARFGTGCDNIDLAAATRLGVPVTRLPDYCVGEVADHTLALLLAVWRDVPGSADAVARGEWDPDRGSSLRRLAGNTLGLVGYGRTAAAVRDRAAAFGLETVGFNRSGDDRGTGCEMVPLDDLLGRSDVVSLHAPLTPETRRLCDAAFLSRMKPGAVLLNVARGGLVDPDAVLAGLESGRLAAFATDVWDPEPPDGPPEEWHPLLRHPRTLATPHTAFASRESVLELRTRATGQIADALAGRRPEHLVNPEVWPL